MQNLIEHSQKTPNAEMIIKIANIFDVTTDLLMRDELEISSDDSD